jgi:phage terminase large subunit-like protein
VTARSLAALPPSDRRAFLDSLTPDEKAVLYYRWEFWSRGNQRMPGKLASGLDWRTWLVLAGRGFGKTRIGAETVRQWVKDYPFVNLIGATADDARDIMVDGESGILAVCPPSERPIYRKSDRQLLWPNGAKSLIFTADEPDRLRGKQHMKLWCDELAAWRYPQESWDQAMLGLRLGDCPQSVVTTTPRPIPIIRALEKAPTSVVTRGTSYENRENLSPAFFTDIVTRYEGTRLGRQELNAEILDDNPLALWKRADIDALRVNEAPPLLRIVVAIDPTIHDGKGDPSAGERAEAGIIVAGLGRVNGDVHGFVLEDGTVYGSPAEWANAGIRAYYRWRADRIVAETNQGGAMVEGTLRAVDQQVSYQGVHASRGKYVRAEPVSALYEQGRVHHVGSLPKLEDELCEWMPGMKSPNRLDALVWGLTALMLEPQEESKTPAANPLALITGTNYAPGRPTAASGQGAPWLRR